VGVKGEGLTTKRHKGTFMGDGNILCLSCGGGVYTTLYVYLNKQIPQTET
jgi:hypothetical protein